jgi:hypothetical protein
MRHLWNASTKLMRKLDYGKKDEGVHREVGGADVILAEWVERDYIFGVGRWVVRGQRSYDVMVTGRCRIHLDVHMESGGFISM